MALRLRRKEIVPPNAEAQQTLIITQRAHEHVNGQFSLKGGFDGYKDGKSGRQALHIDGYVIGALISRGGDFSAIGRTNRHQLAGPTSSHEVEAGGKGALINHRVQTALQHAELRAGLTAFGYRDAQLDRTVFGLEVGLVATLSRSATREQLTLTGPGTVTLKNPVWEYTGSHI